MAISVSKTTSAGGVTKTSVGTITVSDEVVITGQFSVANGQTDKALAISGVDQSQLKAVQLSSTQAVTLETNNASTPDDTIVLAANIPYTWHTGDPHTCLITADITAMYATNASGSTATIDMLFVQDGTP